MVLLAFANGLDRSRVAKQDYEPPKKSAGHGITTMQDLENNAEVWRIMLALTQDIGKKLRLYNKNAAGVAIYIRYIQDKQIAENSGSVSFLCGRTVPPSSPGKPTGCSSGITGGSILSAVSPSGQSTSVPRTSRSKLDSL